VVQEGGDENRSQRKVDHVRTDCTLISKIDFYVRTTSCTKLRDYLYPCSTTSVMPPTPQQGNVNKQEGILHKARLSILNTEEKFKLE